MPLLHGDFVAPEKADQVEIWRKGYGDYPEYDSSPTFGTPVEVFAKSQNVLTIGQNGYGYFSKNWPSYSRISGTDTNIALWAYRRSANSYFGNGGRVPGVVFRPPR